MYAALFCSSTRSTTYCYLYIGITLASIFLLVGLGLSFTFGQMGVINMAHGEFIMIGAYAAFVLQTTVFEGAKGVAILVALPVAFVVSGLMGVLLERLVIRRMYGRASTRCSSPSASACSSSRRPRTSSRPTTRTWPSPTFLTRPVGPVRDHRHPHPPVPDPAPSSC